jgi:hypothetical protein
VQLLAADAMLAVVNAKTALQRVCNAARVNLATRVTLLAYILVYRFETTVRLILMTQAAAHACSVVRMPAPRSRASFSEPSAAEQRLVLVKKRKHIMCVRLAIGE